MSLFDSYGRRARLFPAVLCLPPWILLGRLATDYFVPAESRSLLAVGIGGVTISVGALFLLTQLNRFVGKLFFQDSLKLPTVDSLLLTSARLSPELRNKVRSRIESEFLLPLPTLAEEKKDEAAARLRLSDAVSLVVARVGPGTLLLQHNAEYGFIRNLAGGSVIAVGASTVVAILYWVVGAETHWRALAGLLMVSYLAVLLIRRRWQAAVAEDYTGVLFREFLLPSRAS